MNDKPVWVDSHCHLEMLKGDTRKVLESSREAGMAFCITIGTSHEANLAVKDLSQSFDHVYGTLGFHPHGASRVEQDHLAWIKQELPNNIKLVAVGECGYDLYYNYSDITDQKRVFEAQLNLAIELKLPVVIHSRDADRETRDMLSAFRQQGLTGVVHCFTSDIDQAKFLLDFGFSLSFNGICTFPQAETVRDVLKYTPLDRVLLETDAPYLSPVPYRGKKNFPGRVAIVGEYVAELLGLTIEELSSQVMKNTKLLFPKIDYEN